ncbi:MAG: type II 3-dehydroquinate dehydratase, partial [Propionibacteriaceae bacterium]|nr:type II 3-dehydroquinate dehydratase [Propionibacteriaceae bacterium]
MTTTNSRPLVGLLNGPNLNLLGTRQPEIYGRATLADIESRCTELGDELGLTVECVQSNHEGALVDAVQEWRTRAAGLVVNAAAYTHTSVALRDALLAAEVPFVEVHLSNVHAREPFRHHSYLADVAVAVIAGCGPQGYEFALRHLAADLFPVVT